MSKCDGWSFPSDFGFSGSAGKTMVKGYARGGGVRKAKGGKQKGPVREQIEMAEAPAMIAQPPMPKRGVPAFNRAPKFGK